MPKRKAAMTDRERVEALLDRRKPDRVPIWPGACNGFAVVNNGYSLTHAYTDPGVTYQSLRKTCRDFGWIFFPWMSYASFGAWEFGGEVRMPTGDYDQAPMVLRYPVEKDEDVYNLKWPGPDSGFYPTARKYAELANQERLDNEPWNRMISCGSAYSLACQLVGLEKFLKWLVKKPDVARFLIRQLAEWNLSSLEKRKEALGTEGVLSVVGLPLASNQLISPQKFEEFVLPDLKEGQARLRALGYRTTHAHICGEQNKNLPFYQEVDFGDPGFISVGPEIELETAARYFPGHIITGNLSPAVIQTGTPNQVYEATRLVVETGKRIEGGFIFGPGCELPPKAPAENVKAMTQAVEDYGWYE
jgi:uroporphyrinogen-III decarboxylase